MRGNSFGKAIFDLQMVKLIAVGFRRQGELRRCLPAVAMKLLFGLVYPIKKLLLFPRFYNASRAFSCPVGVLFP
jgi:hypothetical protein